MERFKTLLKLNIKRAYKSLFSLVLGAIALIFLVSAIAFYGTEFLYGGLTGLATNLSNSDNKADSNTESSDTNSSNIENSNIENSNIDNSNTNNSNIDNSNTNSSNNANINTDDSTFFKLGVVMYDSSTLAGTITNTITNMKQISETISFVFTDEKTALDKLKSGQLMAVIVIPENTVDGIIHGKNDPMQVIFPENSGFEAILLKEIADSAATLLSSSQAGIYSIRDFYNSHDASSHRKEAMNRMNLKYIQFAATGMNMFDSKEVTATGQIPLMTYYISGAFVLFTLLLGMNCFSFIKRMAPDTTKRLVLSGCPLILQGLSDYIAIALVMLTAVAIVIGPALLIMNIFGMSLSITGIFALLLIIPIFVLLSSAIIYFISQLTLHNMSRIMITFFISLFMSFISGCFIPTMMLPDTVQFVSNFLPARHMMDMAASLLSGSFDGIAFLACLAYTLVLLGLSILCSHLRLRKELR